MFDYCCEIQCESEKEDSYYRYQLKEYIAYGRVKGLYIDNLLQIVYLIYRLRLVLCMIIVEGNTVHGLLLTSTGNSTGNPLINNLGEPEVTQETKDQCHTKGN